MSLWRGRGEDPERSGERKDVRASDCYGRVFDEAAYGSKGAGVARTDVAVAGCSLLLAGLSWAAIALGGGSLGLTDGPAPDEGLVAVVLNTEGYRAELPLSRDAKVVVEGPLGSNTIEVADGLVRCVEADCSNQVCVDTGWVGEEGQMIVCLPHELCVQVLSDPSKAVPLV